MQSPCCKKPLKTGGRTMSEQISINNDTHLRNERKPERCCATVNEGLWHRSIESIHLGACSSVQSCAVRL